MCECLWDSGIDDTEVTAADEFFEFHECEIGFNAGCIAIHQESDGTCGCKASDLSVSETVFGSEFEDFVPDFA